MSSLKTAFFSYWQAFLDSLRDYANSVMGEQTTLFMVGFLMTVIGYEVGRRIGISYHSGYPILAGILFGWVLPFAWGYWRIQGKKVNKATTYFTLSLLFLVTALIPWYTYGTEFLQSFQQVHALRGLNKITLAVELIEIYIFVWCPILFAGAFSFGRINALFKDRAIRKPNQNWFGSARLATTQDYRQWGFYGDIGTLLGKDNNNRMLRYRMDPTSEAPQQELESRLILAPSGSGKDYSVAIPTLLNENRPMLVNDVKGELWAVTARFRETGFGVSRKVSVVDPFKVREKSLGVSPVTIVNEGFNPLAHISADKYERARQVNALVSAIVITDPTKAIKTHWEEYAETILKSLIHYILETVEESPTLLNVHHCLTLSPKENFSLWNDMMTSDNPAIKAGASKVLETGEDERGSLLSSTYQHLAWLQDPNMQDTLDHNTLTFEGLLDNTQDIFIIVPDDQIKTHSRFVRLVVACAISFLQQQPLTVKPKRDILFLLNELGQLGYCSIVEDAITILRARGARIWAFFQNRDQMKIYAKSKVFEDMDVNHFFGISDVETLKWIQEMAGKHTFMSKTDTRSQQSRASSVASGSQESHGDSWTAAAADLLPLNVIREMSSDEQLVFIKGKPVIQCKKMKYWKEELFKGRYDKNPYAEVTSVCDN